MPRSSRRRATTNYGSLASIRTRKDAGTADTYQSYLTFNVAGVTGPVNSVKLRLFTSDESPNVQSVFSGDPTSWTEGGLNWNNRPTFTTLRGSGAVPTLGAYNEITLDPALITGNVPISLMITSANSNSAIFNSKEAGPNPPQLVITQTVGNQAPTASPVSKSTPHDVAVTVDLAGTDAETCNLVFAPGAIDAGPRRDRSDHEPGRLHRLRAVLRRGHGRVHADRGLQRPGFVLLHGQRRDEPAGVRHGLHDHHERGPDRHRKHSDNARGHAQDHQPRRFGRRRLQSDLPGRHRAGPRRAERDHEPRRLQRDRPVL